MITPFFSVVISTYNSEKTIEKTLKSVFNQTYRDFEIVLVDDGSTDNTLSVIQKIRMNNNNNRFKVIQLIHNSGIAFSRNTGISASDGKYIAFLDGDDLWQPNKLRENYKVLLDKKVEWVFSNYNVIDSNYRTIGKRHRKGGKYGYEEIIAKGNPVGMLTAVVSKSVLLKTPFRKIHHEDYDLWIRIAKKGINGILIDSYLASYMKQTNSLSSNKIKSAIWTYNVYRKNGLGLVETLHIMKNYFNNYFSRRI